ncbi:protein FAR1-RELATED SEQUENCE 5-like [Arachis ipaensis]|uniref:protein FAR1-RELATED SEQUENCE 5-like n=1 Tax=Arachis ipaensis TaxID=130454 RepID=UPI0007AF6F40|nr:protein FAR1-RELATED SEQUENCE 5-like [Arachis ipaensis]
MDNDKAGIRPNKTYLALANEVGGSSNLGFSEKDVRNYITRNLRCSDDNEDFQGMMNYFVRMKEINPNIFYAIDVDDANKFRSALWVYARCRILCEYYGDVVLFDTTYRRNRHGLSFASFVGVNHHGKSTLLGCALLGSEEIPSFEWVFTQWVRCVGIVPRGIITDQCKAMAGAIRKVLPDTVHRWCIWHIMKKSQFKLGGYARYGELNAMMNHIVWNSPSTESFEVDWAGFIKQFNLGQNRWLADLYANRRKWVPIFFKSEFWAGMRSTRRSESMHAFYGGYLHCKTGLVQFIHEYDNVLGNKEQKELEDDAADSKGVIPCIGSTGIERQFQQEYTSNMGDTIFIKVDEQKVFWGKPVYDTFMVEFDPLSRKGQCECNKFESAGILCCHTLAVWSYYRVDTVPSCYILPRWSKNVIRKHIYIKSSHDVARSDESNNLFRHLCSEFYNVAQEFVACEEEAAILRAALWDAKAKLTDYRASMCSTTVADEVDLQSDNDHHGSVNKRLEDSTIWNSSDGGGFMHLLNSFRHI